MQEKSSIFLVCFPHTNTNRPAAGLCTKERKEKTVQRPSERDTVTGRRQDALKYILMLFEEYRVCVLCQGDK